MKWYERYYTLSGKVRVTLYDYKFKKKLFSLWRANNGSFDFTISTKWLSISIDYCSFNIFSKTNHTFYKTEKK